MNWCLTLAALLVIVAIVIHEIHSAIQAAYMWAQFERDEHEEGGP